MSTAIAVVIAIGVVGLLLLGIRAYVRIRGKRVVTCPETGDSVAVEVNALRAVVGAPLRLQECTRWPERQGCGQECLQQIESSPEGCLVRTIVRNWYRDKVCALCSRPLGQIDWYEHQPCILSPDRKILRWSEVRPESIPQFLETHAPVCWNCEVAESFRRQHPELVVDREPHKS